ncbi:hypothetical protein HWV62_35278 [Athelia sp. TMB]|nr:hypothetical protein HWV62_35278 [Athelia sp. TMB]
MSGSSLVQIIVMPALVIFFCVCLWISNRLGWIVNPFTAYLLPPRPGEVELERPMMWDVYTRYRGVKGADEVTWPQIKPFAATVDCAQEQMLVAVTIAMPSPSEDRKEGDADLWEEAGAQHHIGLARLAWTV